MDQFVKIIMVDINFIWNYKEQLILFNEYSNTNKKNIYICIYSHYID